MSNASYQFKSHFLIHLEIRCVGSKVILKFVKMKKRIRRTTFTVVIKYYNDSRIR